MTTYPASVARDGILLIPGNQVRLHIFHPESYTCQDVVSLICKHKVQMWKYKYNDLLNAIIYMYTYYYSIPLMLELLDKIVFTINWKQKDCIL